MNPVRFLAVSFLLISALSGQTFAADGPTQKYNVLFILADQWQAQAFGFAGDPNVKTPNLDRFGSTIRFSPRRQGMLAFR